MSTSHFMMELKAVSSMPAASMPTMDGVNSTSGHLKRSEPIVITCSNPGPDMNPAHIYWVAGMKLVCKRSWIK